MSAQFYRCPSCGATKKINSRPAFWEPTRNGGAVRVPETTFPADLPCGWRGCTDRALPVR